MRSAHTIVRAALALLLCAAAEPCLARTWNVSIGANGQTAFVDEVSGTSTTTITVGDSVLWSWQNAYSYYNVNVPHSTTSGTCTGSGINDTCTPGAVNGMTWDSGLNYYPFTFTQTISAPGTYTYFCAYHLQAMQGTIIVLPPAPPLSHQAGPERLRITPANPTLTHGTPQNFQAFRGFTKASGQPGGEKDVTVQVTWVSDKPSIISIDPTTGVAQAVAVGTATVTATLGHLHASTTVTVQ